MVELTPNAQDASELPPPGSRSGAGARSVLPYLTKTLLARPAHGPEGQEVLTRDTQPRADDPEQRPSA